MTDSLPTDAGVLSRLGLLSHAHHFRHRPWLSVGLVAGWLGALAVLAALLLPQHGSAQTQNADEIVKQLRERMPELGNITVKPLPYGGLLEVVGNGEVFYATSDGKALLFGQLIDTEQRNNLTRTRQAELDRIEWSALPLDKAIKVQRGNGQRMVAIFEDPHCTYCKHLEQDLQSFKDITVYVFLLPILSADSRVQSRNIWCAKNPAAAWQAWILNGVVPPTAPATCQAPLQEMMEFARLNRIKATPTLFFPSGQRGEGAIPREEVEKLMAQKKPA